MPRRENPEHLGGFIDAALKRVWPRGWRGRHPSNKQRAVLSDRDIPVPETRGEAAEQIRRLSVEEGWDNA